ncbi:MAG: hypothetical protein FJX72_19015, partial [Armatimonadetes bacterium]|nr:hypothetical protein [Armatimonadota bacterium]
MNEDEIPGRRFSLASAPVVPRARPIAILNGKDHVMKKSLLILAASVVCLLSAAAAHAEFQIGMCGLGRYLLEG